MRELAIENYIPQDGIDYASYIVDDRSGYSYIADDRICYTDLYPR
jgi:hypothetical protein